MKSRQYVFIINIHSLIFVNSRKLNDRFYVEIDTYISKESKNLINSDSRPRL